MPRTPLRVSVVRNAATEAASRPTVGAGDDVGTTLIEGSASALRRCGAGKRESE